VVKVIAANEIASDITLAGTALGGLLLVFIGLSVTAYESFDPLDRPAVLWKFRRRAYLALSGFIFALISTVFSLVAKATAWECSVFLAAGCLGLSISLVTLTAFLTVADIK
jgi:hypothetical protein